MTLGDDLRVLLGGDAVVSDDAVLPYTKDATEMQGLAGTPDAVVLPADADQVAELVAWCYEREVPLVPRGGGTGFAGGAVPVDGGVVVSMERMQQVLSFDPEQWRMQVEAGVVTGRIHDLARGNGLMFPPDPGASEQSQIGGNIACNAGGPRSFKYGTTGHWVTGIEAVIAHGRRIRAGGPVRKDVAGYDLRSLFVGSEGTLGIITSAWLKLIPAPEVEACVFAAYPSIDAGVERILDVYRSGSTPATLEFFDPGAMERTSGTFPADLPAEARFLVLAEIHGTRSSVDEMNAWMREVFDPDHVSFGTFEGRSQLEGLRRWRGGVSYAVASARGGKLSEDVVVPVDCIGTAIAAVVEIGSRFGLEGCSWGHAGDGNLHASFLIDPASPSEASAAQAAATELFERVLAMRGSVSGEHGLGWTKRDQFEKQFSADEVELQLALKRVFDPLDLFNPGKKVPASVRRA